MQSVESPHGAETESLAPSTVPSPHDGIEILALELAQTLKPSHRAGRGMPVQSRLKKLEGLIRSAYQHFEEASKSKRAIKHAAEWVLDNFYVIEQAIRQVREGMPVDYYRRLPQVTLADQNDVARVYALSTAITAASKSSLDIAQLDSFVRAYQEIIELKIGEIWALPLMLRLSILETLAIALANLTQIPFSAPKPLSTWPYPVSLTPL